MQYSRANIEKVFNDQSSYERHKDAVWFPKCFTKKLNEAKFKIDGTDKESQICRDCDGWQFMPAGHLFFNIYFTPDIQTDRTYLTDKGTVHSFAMFFLDQKGIYEGKDQEREKLFRKAINKGRETFLRGGSIETDGKKFRSMAHVYDVKLSYFLLYEAIFSFFSLFKKLAIKELPANSQK